MKAHDLDLETLQPIDLDSEALKPGSRATRFSTFIWAVAAGDVPTAEAQIADEIQWGLMPYNKVLKGKGEVIPWLRAAGATRKHRS
jgi:hypothetical protein